MRVRWGAGTKTFVDGVDATVDVEGDTIFLPGGAPLMMRLRELLSEPQPIALLEQELAAIETPQRVTQTLHDLMNAQALAPWELGTELALLHQETVQGGESVELSPALESGRILRESGDRPAILLPYVAESGMSLETVLRSRRTCRSFRPEPVPLEEFAAILDLSIRCGQQRAPAAKVPGGPAGERPYPSGGGLYPVEFAIYATHVGGLSRGFYFYQPLGHRVTRGGGPVPDISSLMGSPRIEEVAFFVLLFIDFGRVSLSKYGRKAYRLALLEAGHIAQNLLLSAAAVGLATLPLCSFDDERLSLAAGLRYPLQPVVYVIAVGTRAGNNHD